MKIDKLNALIIHAIGFARKKNGTTFEDIVKYINKQKDIYLQGYNSMTNNNMLRSEIAKKINDLQNGKNKDFGKIIKTDDKGFYSFCEPNKKSIEFWLSKYDKKEYDDGYFIRDKFVEQENAVKKAFACNDFKTNDIENIILKATLINSLYSTSILDLYSICKGMCDDLIYNKINDTDIGNANDFSVVYSIANIHNKNAEKQRLNISFASKYCHHSNPNKFPIYDIYVVDMLLYFYNKNTKFRTHIDSKGITISFDKTDKKINPKHYKQFVDLYFAFKEYYDKDDNGNALNHNLREWDKYLWIAGKHLFYDVSRLKNK